MLSSLALAAGLKKKFAFNATFCLQELLNCTFVSGVLFAKIRLKDGGNFIDVSRRVEVQGHCVKWDQDFSFSCKMYASTSTAELEPCVCKVSIRRETKGGRSYKKLGYVKINLAEYAGAGEVQRKYLLDSYNEHKRKPDNSILKVKISLRQTHGDVLFKAPRATVWELSEAEDEGIQADSQSVRSRVTGPRTSMTSGLSADSTNSVRTGGGSLQDMRRKTSLTGPRDNGRVSNSVGSLRVQSSSSEYNSAGSEDSIQEEGHIEDNMKELKGGNNASQAGKANQIPLSEVPTDVAQEQHKESEVKTRSSTIPRISSPRAQRQKDKLMDMLQLEGGHPRTSVVSATEINGHHPNGTSILSLPGTTSKPKSHRRQTSLGFISSGSYSATASPVRHNHRRQLSMSVTAATGGTSSKSTSAYSTMSERSMPNWDGQETVSICSQRSRLSLFPSSKVEQSRKDARTVIDELMQKHDLTKREEEEEGGSGGLKIYVDKNRGTVTVAGPNLDRKYGMAIELTNHAAKTSGRSKDVGGANKDVGMAIKENGHEQSKDKQKDAVDITSS